MESDLFRGGGGGLGESCAWGKVSRTWGDNDFGGDVACFRDGKRKDTKFHENDPVERLS